MWYKREEENGPSVVVKVRVNKPPMQFMINVLETVSSLVQYDA